MMGEFYVYEHLRGDTGLPFYVGKGTKERAHRITYRSEYWKRVYAKHGRTVRIVASGIDEELAFLAEQELIDKYKRLGIPLVNMTAGGDGARLTGDAKKRHVEALRSAYQRADVRERMAARNAEFLRDADAVARRAASIKAAYQRPEVRAKLKKNARSPYALARHKEAMQRPEVKQKLREVAAKPVLCVETGQEFPMILEATKWLVSIGKTKAQGSKICNVCKGRQKSAYGYTWQYIEKRPGNGS